MITTKGGLSVLGALATALMSFSAQAVVVTFDAAVTPGAAGFSTQGYNFAVQSNHYHIESGTRFGTSTATSSLIIDDFEGDNSLTITQQGGGAFDLGSFNIVSNGIGFGSTTVQITGSQVGGGSLNIFFADLNPNNFATLNLNWGNLLSLRFNGAGNSGGGENFFRLDNINLTATAVPEPASLALFGLGLAGLGFAKIRRKRSK